MPIVQLCPTCLGVQTSGEPPDTCPTCNGSGEVFSAKALTDLADKLDNLDTHLDTLDAHLAVIETKIDALE